MKKPNPQLAVPEHYSTIMGSALTLLFVVLSVLTLISLVQRIASRPDLAGATSQPEPGATRPDAHGDSASLADWHLFGEPAATAAAPAPPARTRQDLVLRGTLTANDPARARAIVADAGGEERAYRIGEELPGGVTLAAIHTDRIVLRDADGEENLFLPRMEQTLQSPERDPGSVAPPGAITADASAIPDDLLRNPSLLAEAVVPMPVWQRNECKGYRFRPGKDAAFMQQVGLLTTDVVSAVNGISLCSDGVLDALQALAVADQVTVSIIRNGQPVDLQVRLQN